MLGELRRNGQLKVPCYSSITDIAGLRFWAHPGIDLHFISHPESQEEVERIAGPGSVRWSKPPTAPGVLEPRARKDARAALGLPQDRTVIAVSGGGWGVGDVVGAVEVALGVADDAEILCLCGRNNKLRDRVSERFAGDPRVRVLGFTNRMGEVLAAANVLIHSSVGLTVLEAIIRGCPVISYGFGYGHVRVSNHALERFKLAQVARTPRELGPAIEHALAQRPEPDTSFAARPSTAAMILNSTRRVQPLPAWRVRARRTVTTAVASTGVVLTAFLWSVAYAVVSDFGGASPTTALATTKPDVAVIVDASANDVSAVAKELRRHRITVSFALPNASTSSVDKLIDYGDDPIPQLGDSGLVGWVKTKGELHRLERELGLSHWGHHHFLYTSSGPSIAQWLLATGAGGTFVEGKVKLNKAGEPLPRSVRKGEIIEVKIKNPAACRREVIELARELHRHHLDAVPLHTLAHNAANNPLV